ncbi:O-antigen ligase family protein [Maribacter sp. ACAM166]|uniref:O-antigen ligase family protein n=1 Tax=Maribacter sp. ACAM166 TaxID=2508996 RepID=UPI0010FF08CC|nr:O-antigen ligase family protein [Maribacter sp. ACAM166]TLP70635.1 hypothetical protein ES765_20595 [Maribacter sp. ACAM166]
MKKRIFICFYIPLFFNILNTQAFISKFISPNLAQLFAYGTLGLILIGGFSMLNQKGSFTPLIKTWTIFYLAYYSFSLLANAVLNTDPPILKNLVPVIYFFGFAMLLRLPSQRPILSKILAIGFFISCLFLIYFQRINFSMDHDGISEYALDRAGGLYGDANNSAVAAILSFLFIDFSFVANTKLHKLLKGLAMAISVYALLLTFSKTGFLVFIIVLGFTYHKFFTVKRILFLIIFIPILLFNLVNWGLESDALNIVQKERVQSLVNLVTLQTDKVSFSGRDVLLENMLGYINENPILGNGLNFGNQIRGHNTIIGVWADAGILTFLIFLFLLGFYLKKAVLAPQEVKFFVLAVLATLYIYMLSLQTIINQGYLISVFVLLGYLLYEEKENSELV